MAALQETTGVGALHQVKNQSYLSCVSIITTTFTINRYSTDNYLFPVPTHLALWGKWKDLCKKILGIFLVSTRSSFYFRIYSIFIAPSLVFIFVTTYLRKKICENLNECLIPFRKQSSGEAKFVRTSALNQPLVFNPHSSAHKTFKAYSSNPTDTPGRLTINNTKQTNFNYQTSFTRPIKSFCRFATK